MSKALELRQNRGIVVKEMTELVETNPTGLSTDQQNRWKELNTKQEELKAQIDTIEATDALDKELRQVDRPSNPQVTDAEKRINPNASAQSRVQQIIASDEYRDAFRSYLKTGRTSPIMGELEEMRTYTGLGDASGATGVTMVPIGFQKQLEIKLKAIGGIRPVAQIITTATGNTLHLPKMDDTANQGSWIAEGTTVNQTNPSLSEVLFGANLASSDQVLVSVQLLQDNAFDTESWLADAFAIRLARLTNLAYTTGSGSGQPNGLITALIADGTRTVFGTGAYANSGNSAQNEVNSIGTADLDAMISAVDPAYRNGSYFMANQATFDGLRGQLDRYGRTLWQVDMAAGQPDRIFGYPFIYNQAMATVAPSANSMLFGNFNKYVVRDVLGFQLVRFNELFMSSHQVGFQAYLRTDGNVLQTAAFSMLQQRLS